VLNPHGAWNVSIYFFEEMCLWDGMYVLRSPPKSLQAELAAIMGLAHVVGDYVLRKDVAGILRAAENQYRPERALPAGPQPLPDVLRAEGAARGPLILHGSLRDAVRGHLQHEVWAGSDTVDLTSLGGVCVLDRDGFVLEADVLDSDGYTHVVERLPARRDPKDGGGGE
jgi:hypothetical protein